MKRRVVITGVGAVTPLGIGAATLVDRWIDGKVGIEDGYGRASEFEAEDFLSKKEARRADRFAQFAIVASDEAMKHAGWSEGFPYDSARIACIVGSGIGGIISLEQQEAVLRERGPRSVSPLAVPLLMGNAAAAAVAMRHGVHGETYGTVSACAAGASAIGAAARLIENGDAEAGIAGGSEAALTGLSIAAFQAMGAMSKSGVCRPFDAKRDGFVMGEGAGILMLEEADAAERRGAEILGEVLGYAATSDAYHLTAPEPSGRDAARAIELALEDAGLPPEEVDYVNAHGTSTPLNDRSESQALKKALGEHAWKVPISSTKSAVGHLFGAAGAVEAIATVLALRREIVPPTLNLDDPEEGLDLDYVPGSARPLARRENGAGARRPIAISNSFGFGGHNVVLCLAAG